MIDRSSRGSRRRSSVNHMQPRKVLVHSLFGTTRHPRILEGVAVFRTL